jgi:hypothetical protein
MNATVALLGLALGQPPAPAPDYYPFNTRGLTIPIEYRQDPKGIRRVELHVSDDGGQVWKLAESAPPTQQAFNYTAPADGRYWFHIVVVDLKGTRDPANLTAEPPAQKVLVDTQRPQVAFTTARRDGDWVTIEWRIDDRHPDDAATKVSFRPIGAGEAPWQEVTLPAGSRNGVRFPTGTPGPVQVRVAVADLAGNAGEGLRDFPAPGGAQTTTSLSPGNAPPAAPVPPPQSIVPTGPEPTGGPVAPTTPPAPTPAPPPMTAPAPPPMTAPPAPVAEPPASTAPQPVPTYDPRATAAGPPATGGPPPAAQLPPPRYLPTTRFELSYRVEVEGSSKVARVDLWVTRDDGRTWRPWSQHPGTDPVVRVNLGTPENRQPEGPYGFRLVSVSGAGLSDAPPAPGDAPEFRAVVDLTKPVVKIFRPDPDPAAPDAVVLLWWAGDANFGDDPITIEWSDPATPGTWRPVAGPPGGDFPVQQVGALAPSTSRRLPNTGRYSWRVPPGLPPRVLLKVSARDAAGNVTEEVTVDPVLIDLTKPRAKITGIGPAPRP